MGKKLMAKLKKRKQELKDRSEGGKYFIIKEGETRMRPLPVDEEEDWAVEVVVFFLGMKIGFVVSPATFGKFCPIMKKYNELSASKKQSDKDLAARFKPGRKWMVPHIKFKDLKGTEVDDQAGAKLLLMTPGVYNELLDYFLDTDEQGDFTHPTQGYDIKYSRTGKGKTDTKYSTRPCKPTKLPKKYNKLYDPVEMVKKLIPSKEELKEKFQQFLNAPPEDDQRSNKKSNSKKKSKSRDL